MNMTRKQVLEVLNKHYKNDVVLKLACIDACTNGLAAVIHYKRKSFRDILNRTKSKEYFRWILKCLLMFSKLTDRISIWTLQDYSDAEFDRMARMAVKENGFNHKVNILEYYTLDEVRLALNIVGDPTPDWDAILKMSVKNEYDDRSIAPNRRIIRSMQKVNDAILTLDFRNMKERYSTKDGKRFGSPLLI